MMFNDRRTIKNPAVAAAAKMGSIQAAPKTKGGLTGKVVLEKKSDFTKRQMQYARKGK